ncbi:NACHT domain-containing protein [Streptomyces sp. NPDC021093]|uniref:NACHT domain-containing protein n=1 Tax=Streptomyces sp. NPDC021093 TaxID=3365112 RepID=UPI003794CB11
MSTDHACAAVAVLGARQGSGVFLGRTILTCSHVIGDNPRSPVRVAHPNHPGTRRYTVAWRSRSLDAALLTPDDSLLRAWHQDARASSTDTRSPLPGCEIVGFPDIQRYDDGAKLDTDHFTGTVLPSAGLIRRELTFEFDRPPADESPEGPSPLAGLSGAPVFAGGNLLGIVRSVRTGRGLRRVTCVPLTLLTEDESFRQVYRLLHQEPVFRLENISGAHPEDPPHEREYAHALRAAYRKTKIFGLDELGKPDTEWDLDTAYLSLEAQSTGDRTARTPQRIDSLLTARPRVLLRGDAGAGKTTLVWWLASHAAAGTLGPGLAELNGLVPYVVPLRTLRAQGRSFPGPAQLPTASRLMIDEAPDGWAGRVLKAGRALILVDGLDEVSQDDREDAHTWLSDLLARYPDNRCIVTSRPLAVDPGWLGSEGFEELRLLPMRNGDIQSFVTAWHRAARLSTSDPHEEISELERDLAHQFRQSPALADLARTPLLCAVICAVHRARQGFLPETRWDLYRSALNMLLGNRDKRRKIGSPEGIEMTIEEHTQLLQRIAIWQVRGGQTEFTRLQAVRQLQPALAGMERVRAQGSSDAILTHLVNRTGLLQERTDDFFQFTHRTFQDFLAAREFVEGDHIAELLLHAENPQWEDVTLLAAGHCNRRELHRLLTGLLECGTRPVLTALCAQHATYLDETLARHIRNQLRTVVPPASSDHAAQLARLGPSAIPLLPPPGELSNTHAHCTIRMLARIGGAEALEYAAGLARSAGEETAQELTDAWSSFPTAEYARDVLARLASSPYEIAIGTAERLAQLPLLADHYPVITLGGTYEGQDLYALADAVRNHQQQ